MRTSTRCFVSPLRGLGFVLLVFASVGCGFDSVDLSGYGATEVQVVNKLNLIDDGTGATSGTTLLVVLMRPGIGTQDEACLHPLSDKVVARLNGKELRREADGSPRPAVGIKPVTAGHVCTAAIFRIDLVPGSESKDEVVIEDGADRIRVVGRNLSVERRFEAPTSLVAGTRFRLVSSPLSDAPSLSASLMPVDASTELDLGCEPVASGEAVCTVPVGTTPGNWTLHLASQSTIELEKCEGVPVCWSSFSFFRYETASVR